MFLKAWMLKITLLYSLLGSLAGIDGETIFFRGRGGAGRGKAKNLRGGAGRGTPPLPTVRGGAGKGSKSAGLGGAGAAFTD